VRGFGVASVHRFDKLADADKHLKSKTVDMIIIDPNIEAGAGYDFVKDMRRSSGVNAYTPVILISGHVKRTDVARARDTGANFIVSKPFSGTVLLQRIMWVARDVRSFVQVASGYVGPDRRFKFEGPPVGSDGRRESDLKAPLGEAKEPNLSQDEVAAMIRPQRVEM
jgi:DNA-binding response OmpR family regulator